MTIMLTGHTKITYGCVVGPINLMMAHSKSAKKFALNGHHYGLTTALSMKAAITTIVILKGATTGMMRNGA